MKSKNELKEIDVKNCASYYFDDLINGTDINFNNIGNGNLATTGLNQTQNKLFCHFLEFGS